MTSVMYKSFKFPFINKEFQKLFNFYKIFDPGEDFFHPEKGIGYLIEYLDRHSKEKTRNAKKQRYEFYKV